jgi:hypothetical protein
MSRRLVSVCILALAGMAGFFAARTASNERRAFPPEPQLRKFDQRDRRVYAGAVATPARVSPAFTSAATLGCGIGRSCVAPLAFPMTFEPNMGQFDGRVKYAGRGRGMTLLLTDAGIDVGLPDGSGRKSRTKLVQVRFGWADANERVGPKFAWRGEQQVKGVSNYFIGKDSSAWRTNVPHFARVAAESHRGEPLGVAVYSTGDRVEYDLRLSPGADARTLRMRFSGARSLKISGGDLLLEAGGCELRMGNPRLYDELDGGVRKIVRGRYVLEPDGSVGLRIGKHDSHATLVIDPSLSVSYATFLGGAGSETAGSVAIDASGKVYVSGVTTSATTFPEPAAASISPVVSASAFYVAKIDPTISGAIRCCI